jgi:hypothetical protein
MAYGPGQPDAFCRCLEKLIRNNDPPRAILLSGGGNDIAGQEFRTLLNHAKSPIAGLNDDVLHGVIDQRIWHSYISIIAQISHVADRMLGQRIPIVIHGYDYAVPDGRGFLGGWGPLPGPWLEPGFHDKGFDNLTANKLTIHKLIDRFNDMLHRLVGIPGFGHVQWIDLRHTLLSDAHYKRDWGNELHPSESGFKLIAAKFAAAL